jgi:hypothetical protein
MDTSTDVVVPTDAEDTPMNGVEEQASEPSADTKTGKRKRSTKKGAEIDETNIPNGRPKRTFSKRKSFSLTYHIINSKI